MLKYNKKTLDELAYFLNESDIANFAKILKYLKLTGNSTLPDNEILTDLSILEEITRLKQEKKYYAFHIEDSWADEQTGQGEGISLYVRIGNKLKEAYSHCLSDRVPQENEILNYLYNQKISTIYTGDISVSNGFLGVIHESIDENDGHSIIHAKLKNDEISYFASNRIKITVLDYLL